MKDSGSEELCLMRPFLEAMRDVIDTALEEGKLPTTFKLTEKGRERGYLERVEFKNVREGMFWLHGDFLLPGPGKENTHGVLRCLGNFVSSAVDEQKLLEMLRRSRKNAMQAIASADRQKGEG